MRTTGVRIGLVLALVLTGGGCVVAGTAQPMSEASAIAAAKAMLTGRPKDIRLDGFGGAQVCSLVNPAQRRQLGLDQVGASQVGDEFDNRGCHLVRVLGEPNYAYVVTPVPQEGADVWLRPGATNVQARVVRVAGYPAVLLRRETDRRGCFVDVSVADGQRLRIQYTHVSEPLPQSPEELCAKAEEMANLTTQNLVDQRG